MPDFPQVNTLHTDNVSNVCSEAIMISRIRKAVMAGVTAGAGAAVAVLAKSGWHLDQATVSQALGAFVAAAAVAGWATWRVPNEPAGAARP
jgi:hypothetical protein